MTHRIRTGRLNEILRALIDIYSPSGKELEVQEYLQDLLERSGAPVSRQQVDDDRYNLLIMPPSGEAEIVFVGHVDTVAAHDLDRFEYERVGDRVAGLGAADMKGGLAAILEAYLSFAEAKRQDGGPEPALALVVGEEEDGDGMERFLEEYRCSWALLGEPTHLAPCLEHYGYVEIQLLTRGKRVHASLASPESSAVETLLQLVSRLTGHLGRRRREIVYNVRDLQSSQVGFAAPDWCEAWIDAHLPPAADTGEILVELEELLAAANEKGNAVDAAIRFATVHDGYRIAPRGFLVETLQRALETRGLPSQPAPFPSHSDASLLFAAGVKPILFGPGHLEQAHAPDEWVSFHEVCAAAEIYLDVMLATTRPHP